MNFENLVFGSKGLESLTDEKKEIEFILPKHDFGRVNIHYKRQDGSFDRITDIDEKEIKWESINNLNKYTYKHNSITLSWEFILKNDILKYNINISNESDEDLDILDLLIMFPMNTKFDWGIDASLKVLRHSHISGNNSYLFFTPCGGQPPYLVMTPNNINTSLEYFDLHAEESKDKNADSQYELYQAYVHSFAQEKIAREKGCSWRQTVSKKTLHKKTSGNNTITYSFAFQWAKDYTEIRNILVKENMIDIKVVPGMTLPFDLKAKIALTTTYEIKTIIPEFQEETTIILLNKSNNKGVNCYIYEVEFTRLGENRLDIIYGDNLKTYLEFFVSEQIKTLIQKRASFISKTQVVDEKFWYDGLFAEWNNETKTMLTPDNYDKISGWRIYEVTCDDPGLSKPSFLASKNSEYPVAKEIESLDYYIDKFVWGGLQCTDNEEYPYGIYGIPDWHKNRNSDEEWIKGKTHIWRIYDYPHIAVLYWNMYKIARDYPSIKMSHTKELYLERAYKTALAMFLIPEELVEWSAFKTGLYNELIYEDIFFELEKIGEKGKSIRLRNLWERKVMYFVTECKDVFGSEYPFDTTGFESTYAFAKYAINNDITIFKQNKYNQTEIKEMALEFYKNQFNCNVACRGYLEYSYYLLGSDIRGNNAFYTLSYMSQMAAGAIIDYAITQNDNKDDYLRLGYASLLSSWALLNSGTKKSGYGYWFSGIESDGAAGGGFEPSPFGKTWLEQPHHRGSWYYSCEIDLGFSGYLRNACTILTDDDVFGVICLGGDVFNDEDSFSIVSKDGIGKRLIVITDMIKFEITISKGRFGETPIYINKNNGAIEFEIDSKDLYEIDFSLKNLDNYTVICNDKELIKNCNQYNYVCKASITKISIYIKKLVIKQIY